MVGGEVRRTGWGYSMRSMEAGNTKHVGEEGASS